MRFASVIILSLLIQTGLFGRVVTNGLCCPVSSLEHCHDHDAGHGDSHDGCHDSDSPVGDDKCPSDCGEHHHHHGNCIHSMQFSISGEGHHRLAPPLAVSLGCDRQHLRAPDGPVMEMDKPPLI